MKMSELLNEALSLPADERARLVDSLLQTLNPVDEANTTTWLAVAKQRLDDLDSGCVKAIPDEEVLRRWLSDARVMAGQAFTLADARVHGEAMLMTEPNAWQQLEEEHLTAAVSGPEKGVP